jgi:hypothetical protein
MSVGLPGQSTLAWSALISLETAPALLAAGSGTAEGVDRAMCERLATRRSLFSRPRDGRAMEPAATEAPGRRHGP